MIAAVVLVLGALVLWIGAKTAAGLYALWCLPSHLRRPMIGAKGSLWPAVLFASLFAFGLMVLGAHLVLAGIRLAVS